jgi:hypothetical protein
MSINSPKELEALLQGNASIQPSRDTLVQGMAMKAGVERDVAKEYGNNLYGAGILTGFINENPEIVYNLPSSTAKLVSDIIEPILSPIETLKSFKDIGEGLLSKLGIVDSKDKEELVDAMGDYMSGRYGSTDAFMNSLRTDPAGVTSDIAGIVTGGASIAAKAPGKVGQIAKQVEEASSYIDPVNVVGRAGEKALDATGIVAKNALGVSTGVGPDNIQGVFDAAREGGDASATSAQFLRGGGNAFDIVEDFDDGVELFKKQAQSEYLHGKLGLGLDELKADYTQIYKFIEDDLKKQVFPHGKDGQTAWKTPNNDFTQNWKDLRRLVGQFRRNPVNQNVASMDELKKSIDIMVSQLPENVPANVATIYYKLRRKVRDEIERLAPEYGEVMKPYEEAQELLNEFRTEFRAGRDQSSNQVLRKLQQSLRNNVNTNFGEKLNLLKQIDDMDEATNIVASISGRAMSDFMPAGIARYAGPTAGATFGLTGNIPEMAAVLTGSSPRVVGEATRGAGQFRGLLDANKDIISRAGIMSRYTGSMLDPVQETEDEQRLRTLLDEIPSL